MSTDKITVLIGNIIHCDKPFSIVTIERGFIIIKGSKIIAISHLSELNAQKTKLQITSCEEILLKDSQILIPGLIDTHIHAPQYPNIGMGYDLQLLEWLDKYTYNLERKYKDLDFSKKVFDAVVRKTLDFGTTTACYFASLFEDSSMVLVNSAISYGQRALVGKVNMTKCAPADYVETPEDSILNTEKFIKAVLDKKSDLVKPIITPRFALSVDMDMMEKLGKIAEKHNCNIQTHISENCSEIKAVTELYGTEYAEVYDKANLLTKKTILAHGVHLKDSELLLIGARGSSIAHCPASNNRLQSGMCDVRRLVASGISVGLGTDVAGGDSVSIIDAMRMAVDTSIHLSYNKADYKPLTCYDAFYLATLGGAKSLSMDDKIGNFVVGKEFDALIIDMDVPNASIDYLQECNTLELLQKFIYSGCDKNVINVFVAGQKVK